MVNQSGVSVARRLIYNSAALMVVCVFLFLPTLLRLHDHLSTADKVASFRLSKNLERPHSRHSNAPPLRLVTTSDGHDQTPAGLVTDLAPLAPRLIDVGSSSDRAPPTR
jgi:hypothetical protein